MNFHYMYNIFLGYNGNYDAGNLNCNNKLLKDHINSFSHIKSSLLTSIFPSLISAIHIINYKLKLNNEL